MPSYWVLEYGPLEAFSFFFDNPISTHFSVVWEFPLRILPAERVIRLKCFVLHKV